LIPKQRSSDAARRLRDRAMQHDVCVIVILLGFCSFVFDCGSKAWLKAAALVAEVGGHRCAAHILLILVHILSPP
jgi:hypothetical protein